MSEEKSPALAPLSFQHLNMQERLIYVKTLKPEEQYAQGMVLRDEWANSFTHAVGFLLSILGAIFLTSSSLEAEDYTKLFIFSIYGFSLVLLYAVSTLYHSFRKAKLKQIFRIFDHCAIYLLIAGSYTPFTMLLLEGIWAWSLISVIWTLACIGIVFKVFFTHRFELLSTFIYLFMGWLVIVASKPIISNFHYLGLIWLIAGGVFYTSGVIFYALDKRRFFHAIWHLFVMAGSVCHYIAIFLYL